MMTQIKIQTKEKLKEIIDISDCILVDDMKW